MMETLRRRESRYSTEEIQEEMEGLACSDVGAHEHDISTDDWSDTFDDFDAENWEAVFARARLTPSE